MGDKIIHYFCFIILVIMSILVTLMPCTGSVAHSTGDVRGWISSIIGIVEPGDEPALDDMEASVSEVDASDLILDVGSDPKEYVYGAIHIPYTDFLDENNTLKPLSEVARILGDAGISRNDSVVIYGKCPPCGGGPSTATFVYWIMRYAGHDRVRLLDGGLEAWKAAGRPTQDRPAVRNRTVYELSPRPDLLANYTYIRSCRAQLIDARLSGDYTAGTIPGSVNIPYEEVIDGDRIRSKADLERVFRGIDIEKPVAVYTFTGVKASVVWFALASLGYDAKLYTYQDWHNHHGSVYLPNDNRTITYD